MHPLAEQWTSKAESKETAAKGYNSRCSTVKGVQCLLEAKIYRKCAEQLLAYEASKAGEASAAVDPAPQGSGWNGAEGVGSLIAESEASFWPRSASSQLPDQTP